MRIFFTLLITSVLFSCQEASRPAQQVEVEKAVFDDKEFETIKIDGSDALRVERKGPQGRVIEQGFVLNGLKHGTWTTYSIDSKAPETIISYIEGALNGPYIEMDDLGRFALIANYKANVLDGPYGKYKIGRPELIANYVNGQLDGPMAEYDYRNNKLKQEVNYKMGKKHGPLRYFNEEGKVTLEYIYENDERVSGGIVE
jgi:antitoxin component YwqK of YwqJK toxin-antitoxin module